MQKVFYDSEFTGLHSRTSLISLALVSEDGRKLYAEFTDYDESQVDDFVRDNVLANTHWLNKNTRQINSTDLDTVQTLTTFYGDKHYIANGVSSWLKQFELVQIWADHVSYDWVLFCELFAGALNLPNHIHYIPMDLCTFMECHGYNADCDRTEFAQPILGRLNGKRDSNHSKQHNALYDAEISLACYQRVLIAKTPNAIGT